MNDRLPEPPPAREMPPGRFERRRAHFERELRRPLRRRSRRIAVLVPLGTVLVAGGALASGIFTKPLSDPDRVQCYAGGDLDSRHTAALTSQAPDVGSPRALCAPFYERGFLTGKGVTPQLTACLDAGVVRVFADAPDACARLEMTPISDSEYERERARVRKAFDTAAVGLARAGGATISTNATGAITLFVFPDGPCVTVARAIPAVQGELSRAGLGDFHVRADPRLKPAACATVAGVPDRFDGRTIELEGPGTDGGPDRMPTLDEISESQRAEARYERHVCDHPLGRRGARQPNELQDVLACRSRRYRGDPREENCFAPAQLRALVRRFLDHEGLHDWRIRIAGGPPPGAQYQLGYLGPPVIDARIRQISMALSEHCLDYGLSLPRG